MGLLDPEHQNIHVNISWYTEHNTSSNDIIGLNIRVVPKHIKMFRDDKARRDKHING